MLYNNTFTKLAFFLLTGNALASVAPKVTVANGVNVHTSNGATRLPVIPSALAHHDDGWFPTKENLIFNKTVVEGDPAGFYFGWTFPGPIDAEPFFDGFSKNITMFLTPPGGVEEFIIGCAQVSVDNAWGRYSRRNGMFADSNSDQARTRIFVALFRPWDFSLSSMPMSLERKLYL